jgi:hypothetical protein
MPSRPGRDEDIRLVLDIRQDVGAKPALRFKTPRASQAGNPTYMLIYALKNRCEI